MAAGWGRCFRNLAGQPHSLFGWRCNQGQGSQEKGLKEVDHPAPPPIKGRGCDQGQAGEEGAAGLSWWSRLIRGMAIQEWGSEGRGLLPASPALDWGGKSHQGQAGKWEEL